MWSTAKKQRLIDTVLRGWHVPPIHLVARGSGKFDVLDGQQRLTAIRDFRRGDFPVDGNIEPRDAKVSGFHGLRFGQLPEGIRDEFDTFSIRVFELHDYSPDEPHELFFRLNQPVTLTEAEKRNAFIGPARNQVSELVKWAESVGMTSERLGFSNARMAYEDLVARFLLTIEQNSLLEKVTAMRITTRYREKDPFENADVEDVRAAIATFFESSLLETPKAELRPNKATIHTWLGVLVRLRRHGGTEPQTLAATLQGIERVERLRLTSLRPTPDTRLALNVFNDRATSRVADVSSIVLRDLSAWALLSMVVDHDWPQGLVNPARELLAEAIDQEEPERALADLSVSVRWGSEPWF